MVRSASRLKYNMYTFSTLPVELVYRIMDHQNQQTLFCSMQNVSRRLNQILGTYERYRVSLFRTLIVLLAVLHMSLMIFDVVNFLIGRSKVVL